MNELIKCKNQCTGCKGVYKQLLRFVSSPDKSGSVSSHREQSAEGLKFGEHLCGWRCFIVYAVI